MDRTSDAAFRTFRIGPIGNVAQNGCIGTPLAVYGTGCVGHTSSPGTSVFVSTAVSTIGLMGWPVSRFQMYKKQFFHRRRRL